MSFKKIGQNLEKVRNKNITKIFCYKKILKKFSVTKKNC